MILGHCALVVRLVLKPEASFHAQAAFAEAESTDLNSVYVKQHGTIKKWLLCVSPVDALGVSELLSPVLGGIFRG